MAELPKVIDVPIVVTDASGNKKTLSTLRYVRVINCKDCKHYHEHKWFEINGFGTDIEHVCTFYADGVKVEPDGYCWKAERRES